LLDKAASTGVPGAAAALGWRVAADQSGVKPPHSKVNQKSVTRVSNWQVFVRSVQSLGERLDELEVSFMQWFATDEYVVGTSIATWCSANRHRVGIEHNELVLIIKGGHKQCFGQSSSFFSFYGWSVWFPA
jgi:hypothetical protein